jgi:hypothetical protein
VSCVCPFVSIVFSMVIVILINRCGNSLKLHTMSMEKENKKGKARLERSIYSKNKGDPGNILRK